MVQFGKPDATGRSSGRLNRAEAKLLGPPRGEAWVWLTCGLLESEAWRGMSVNCRRLIDRLLIEHCKHAGRENGRLVATYNQLVAYGISRKKIRHAIVEARRRGLIQITRRGGLYGIDAHRTPSNYRLTFVGCVSPPAAATNDWRHFEKSKNRVPAAGTAAGHVNQDQPA